MATPESEGRILIDAPSLAAQGQNIGGLYKALMGEYNTFLMAQRVPLLAAEVVAFKGKTGGQDPNQQQHQMLLNDVNGRLNYPEEYALEVPEAATDREELLAVLAEMFAKCLRAGSAPVNDADMASIREATAKFMPVDVKLPNFPSMLRSRVDIQHGLVKGGVVEAYAMLVRTLSKTKDPQEAVKSAQDLALPVQNKKGRDSTLGEVDYDLYSDTLGKRINRGDDKANTPALVAKNQALYESISMRFGDDFRTELDAVFVAFGKNVDLFAGAIARVSNSRDPNFLRVQWYFAMLSNMLAKLNPNEEGKVKSALTELAAKLLAATSTPDFMSAINNIGQEKVS